MRLFKHATCWICIASQIVLLGCQQESPRSPSFKETDRIQAIDRLKCQLITARHLVNAKISAINSTSDFIDEKINHDRLEDLTDSLSGPFDAFSVLFDSRFGTRIEEAFNKRFAVYVYHEGEIDDLVNKLKGNYRDALLAISADTFMLASDSDYPYPGFHKLQAQIDHRGVIDPAEVFGGNKSILGRAVLEAVDATLMAVEGSLIVVGLVAAPETGGLSLFLTLAGGIILAVDQAWATFQVSSNDALRAQLHACSTRNLHGLMIETPPNVSKPATVGEASLSIPQKQQDELKKLRRQGEQPRTVVENLHKSAVENVYPKVINAIFGEGQEQ